MKPATIDTQAAEIREWAKQEFSRLRRTIGQMTRYGRHHKYYSLAMWESMVDDGRKMEAGKPL